MAHSKPLYFSPSQAQLYFIINKTMLSITTLPTSATIKALSAFYQSHEIRIIIILYFWMFHINFCSHQSIIFKAMYKLSQLQTYEMQAANIQHTWISNNCQCPRKFLNCDQQSLKADRPFTLSLRDPTMLAYQCVFTLMRTWAFMVKSTWEHIKNYLHKGCWCGCWYPVYWRKDIIMGFIS